MLEFLLAALAITMTLALVRAAIGPGWFDRVLALNVLGTLTIILLVLISTFTELYALIDIALLYGLINFVSTIAILRFFNDRLLPLPRFKLHLKRMKKEEADD